MADGDYELICKDSYGDGWNGGYITINGKRYCGKDKHDKYNFRRGRDKSVYPVKIRTAGRHVK